MPTPHDPRDLSWMKEHPQAFSNAAAEALLHYVYMLTIPETGRPFYIGEGVGSRVFEHVKEAAVALAAADWLPTQDDLDNDVGLRAEGDDETQSRKIRSLMDILARRKMPGMYILREGMSQQEALRMEGACIDLLQYMFDRDLVTGLTNLNAGHGTATFRSVEDVEAAHGESFDLDALPDRDPTREVLFLNINHRWGEVRQVDPTVAPKSLLEASQEWRLDPQRAARCQYVVVHALGVVRGVFRVTGWSQRNGEGRINFYADTTPPDGLPGPALRNKNVGELFRRGRASARYV